MPLAVVVVVTVRVPPVPVVGRHSEDLLEGGTAEEFPKHFLRVAEREREAAEDVELVVDASAVVPPVPAALVVPLGAVAHQTFLAVLVVDATFFLI